MKTDTGMETERFKKEIIPLQSAMQLLAEHMLGDADDAADVVQEVFVSLWERREELDRIARRDSYCMQCVRLRCIDLIRERKKRAELNETMRAMTDEAVYMEVEETDRRSQLLHRLLDELPERQRRAIELKYFEMCDTEQLSQRLQMSSNNVYVTLSRAMQTLRERLTSIQKRDHEAAY